MHIKDPETLRRSEEHLEKILDEADKKLSQTTYLLGEEFTLADIVLVPLLSRLVLLNLKNKYVATRTHLAKYWNPVKKRPSYIKVIGKYFDGWRRHVLSADQKFTQNNIRELHLFLLRSCCTTKRK